MNKLIMRFNKNIYKRDIFYKAVEEVEKDFNLSINLKESEDFFEIDNENDAVKVADYYIYIFNENN
jgi:hypothetical protein